MAEGSSPLAPQGPARHSRPRSASRPSPGTVRPVCRERPLSPLARSQVCSVDLPRSSGAQTAGTPFPPLGDTFTTFEPTP